MSMSSDLTPYRSGVPSRAEARVRNQTLERLHHETSLRLARLNQEIELDSARIDGIVFVTKRGMEGAGLISQLESQLSLMIPGSEGRLQFIADRAVLAIGDVISETNRCCGQRCH